MLPKPLHPIAYPKTLEELKELGVLHNRQLVPQMIGIHSLFSGVLHNSPSRSVMTSQHLAQHLKVSGLEPPRVMVGLEWEIGKYTFSTTMPHTGEIVRVIQRYKPGASGINGVPQLAVIYRKEVNNQYDYFTIDHYRSFHQYFGWQNKTTPAMNLLYVGSKILAGTKFADSPGVTDCGAYCYGVNFETACIDIPGVAEDGVIVSRSALKKLRIKVYETVEISFGRNSVPLNLYGNKDNYKIMPDIGEYVRPDGLCFVTRPNLPLMSPALMNQRDLMNVDHVFDEKVYTREKSVDEKTANTEQVHGGKVIDIQVVRNPDCQYYLPPSMTAQLEKYAQALKSFSSDLLSFENKYLGDLRRIHRDARPNFSPKLIRELTRARAVTGHSSTRFQGPVGLQYRRNALDEYTVTMVIEHELEPRAGWKITDVNGG